MNSSRGSVLYPQLLDTAAKHLAADRSAGTVDDLARLASVEHPDTIFTPTGGNRVDRKRLERIQAVIRNAATVAGYPANPSEPHRRSFDAVAARLLHECMGIVPAEASKRGVWQFMSCVLLPDVVRWRFPGTESRTSEDRFLGNVRNAFGRLWWRAEILYEPSGDSPYELLALLGEDELVQIMERPSLAGNRALAVETARALVKVAAEQHSVNRMFLMRDVQKRVMRLSPFIAFESVDTDTLGELVSGLFHEALRHLG